VHSDVEGELRSLIEWTAGIEGTGAVLGFFTCGMSEVAAQVAETRRIAQTAAKVVAILARIGPEAIRAATTIADIAEIATSVSLKLEELISRPLVGAPTETVPTANTIETQALSRLESAAAQRRVHIGGPKQFDPQVLQGMTMADVRASIPPNWTPRPSGSGGGYLYEDPNHSGRQIRLMPGYPQGSRPNPITTGPYVVVSQNGEKVKVALYGNPTLS
jgi:hypothetical protein